MKKAGNESRVVDTTLQSLKAMEELMDDMQDIETGNRGYVISGDKNFLQPYYSALQDLKRDTVLLKTLYPIYPQRKAVLDDLLKLVKSKAEFSISSVDRLNTYSRDSAYKQVQSGKGSLIMDSIRQIIFSLENEDRKVLQYSNKQRGVAAATTAKLFGLLAAIFISILITLFLRIRLDLKNQNAYQKRISYLANIVEQASDAIISTDTHFNIVSWNNGAEEIYGYTKSEAIEKKYHLLLGSQRTDSERREIIEVLKNTGYYAEELEYIKKNRQSIFVLASFTLLKDKNNAIAGYSIVHRDITEKKKAENLLLQFNEKLNSQVREKTIEVKELLDRFKIVAKATNDVVWDADLKNGTVWWNDNFTEKFGYVMDDTTTGPRFWDDHIHPDDKTRVTSHIEYVLSQTKANIWSNEYRFMKPDGEYVNIYDRSYIMRDEKGDAYRMIGSMTDVTDLFLVRRELNESEEKYRTLVEQTTDGIFVADLDGKFVFVNTSACKLLHYPMAELLQLSIYDVLDKEDMKRQPLRFPELREGKNLLTERTLITKEGLPLFVEANARQLSDGRLMAFIRDISERKKAEANQQRQFEELQQLYNLSVLIDRENDIDKIYGFAMDALINGVKADRCSILLFDETGIMRFKASKGLSAGYIKTAEGHSPWNANATEIAPIFIEDVLKSTGLEKLKDVIINEGIRSLSFIPIVFHGKLIGKFMIYYNSVHVFENNEIQFTQTLAHNIGFSVERNKSNKALQASESRYHSLVEQAADAIALFDSKGKILEVNDSALNLLGYKYGELMSMSLADILTKEEILNNPVQYDLLQKGLSTIKQRKMKKKDGSMVTVEVNSKILPDGRFLSMVRDLTDRIEAQKQIEKEKELSDSIIDSLPGVFYFYDQSGKFIRWNKQLEIVTGYSGKEISKMHPTQLFHGADIKYIQGRIAKVFTEGVADAEAEFVFKDGVRKPYYFKAILVDFEGKPCLLGTGIDISDRKKAEMELNDSYKAVRKLTSHLQNVREEERAHIAREIHDELGQQLTVLKMDVSWINKKLTITDDLIKQKMKSLLIMLDDTVKTIRRISSELRPSLLDDLGLTAAMEWQLHEFKKRSEIKTSFSAPEPEIKLPDMIKTGLFRIFQESLTNVVRHSHAKRLKVSLSHTDDNFVLTIADNGKGFDKEKIENKRTLGILGMKERTSMIGGTYEIISTPGNGTIVVVTIPLIEQNN